MSQELNREVAEKAMGETLWVEQRGGYKYIIVQHEGEREPWFAYQNGEQKKGNYSRLGGTINEMKHIVTPALKHYSTRIDAAWLVVERMLELGWSPTLNIVADGTDPKWHVCLQRGWWDAAEFSHGYADTAPEAICRAALKALESSQEAAGGEEVGQARG